MHFTLTPGAPAAGYGEALLPVEDVKAWLRVDGDHDDALVEALRDAAIDFVEQYTNVRLAPVTGIVARFDGFGERMRFGVGPFATVTIASVDYVDNAGADQTLAASAYRVTADGGIRPATGTNWPDGAEQVRVTFAAGYPVGACPSPLLAAAKMFAAHLYANREGVVTGTITAEVPLGVMAMCDRFRMPVL